MQVSENAIPPIGVVCLLQIEEDSDKVLARKKCILYVVIYVNQVVKSRKVAGSLATTILGEKEPFWKGSAA